MCANCLLLIGYEECSELFFFPFLLICHTQNHRGSTQIEIIFCYFTFSGQFMPNIHITALENMCKFNATLKKWIGYLLESAAAAMEYSF